MYVSVGGAEDARGLIAGMAVRGAPAIAVSGALGVAMELRARAAELQAEGPAGAAAEARRLLQRMVTARPTAVNLSEACARMAAAADAAAAAAEASAGGVLDATVACAEGMLAEDLADNRKIGAYGAPALVAAARERGRGAGLRVLTHCNTGALATAGYGTALGCVRELWAAGDLERAYCTETRPYGQGARLTAYELVAEGIPGTLIADSAAAGLMQGGGLDAIVVGADRIANNGDVANKVGTLPLALAAQEFGVPFFVAATSTTVDFGMARGVGQITIEERSGEELTHSRAGERLVVEGISTWNPAFDVTPGALVAGIITELGVLRPGPGGTYDLEAAVRARGGRVGAIMAAEEEQAGGTEAGGSAAAAGGPQALDLEGAASYIEARPELAALLGGSKVDWSVKEVGDGNINFVFIVEGPGAGPERPGALVLKQALPYVRCVGEAWPLSAERARFEAAALRAERACCPAHVPEVMLYDERASVIVMQYLAPPHLVLRKGLVAGECYPNLAAQVATFLADTLFKTSPLFLSAPEYRAKVAEYSRNSDMCALTEQVVFTDPYGEAQYNRWTSPQLDGDVAALWADTGAKTAAARLKLKFLSSAQSLLHGDLHTGSLMVTKTTMWAIDPEFAFYGPIGFDVGAFLANLFLCYFASAGLPGDRSGQRTWLLETVESVWDGFCVKFLGLWSAHVRDGGGSGGGSLCSPAVFGEAAPEGSRSLEECQKAVVSELFRDTLGFAGAKMIRRIVGIAHVEDLESIEDADARAGCERRALRFGRELLVNTGSFKDARAVIEAAQKAFAG